ncbi:LCP family protein [Actinacidiphila sp. DG2A-62]|uniref:LCP family glycopolymer transferase n=1 Tax=Actinacidiphila sp. DG2A-62 TaxID=3108821 RepID=UPI002DB933E5|nr:LCP family protein [Actinacidiphila sp. DG2A-62]MEC3995903.1 LCP family protein [Actinacidiphila sp. DG2A-62]
MRGRRGYGAGGGAGPGAAAAGSDASAGAGSDADAAVLLHLSAGRGRAVVLGVPAALRVRAPEHCGATGAYERFGDAFRRGGAACAIRAFEGFGGVRVDHHLVVDLRGYRRIAAAVGGGDASDGSAAGGGRSDGSPGSTAGGDGSDGSAAGGGGSHGRDGDRRGDLLRALAREARGGDGGLAHPARLYGFLDTATSSITADPGLSSLAALYQLAGELRALPPDGIAFRTVPLGAGGAPRVPDADLLLDAVRTDRPPPAAAAAPAARAPAPASPRSPAPGRPSLYAPPTRG